MSNSIVSVIAPRAARPSGRVSPVFLAVVSSTCLSRFLAAIKAGTELAEQPVKNMLNLHS